jgi:hypothetical protein
MAIEFIAELDDTVDDTVAASRKCDRYPGTRSPPKALWVMVDAIAFGKEETASSCFDVLARSRTQASDKMVSFLFGKSLDDGSPSTH